MNTKRIAVIGTGIGLEHLKTLKFLESEFASGMAPFLISGIGKISDSELSPKAKDIIGTTLLFIGESKIYDLIDRSDCVLVATPSKNHSEYASYALDIGLHVPIEKPLVEERVQGYSLISLAERRERSIDSATQMRSHRPGLAQLLTQVGKTTTIVGMNITYILPTKPPRIDPPIIPNTLPHPLSVIPDLSDLRVNNVTYNSNVKITLVGREFPIFIELGYAPQEQARRKLTLYTDSGNVERLFSASFSPEKGYCERWFSDEDIKNPRESLWRTWINNILAQDIPEKRQACLEHRAQIRKRTLQEHELLMQAMEK